MEKVGKGGGGGRGDNWVIKLFGATNYENIFEK